MIYDCTKLNFEGRADFKKKYEGRGNWNRRVFQVLWVSVKEIFQVNAGFEQIQVGEVHLVEDEVLEGLFQVCLSDEHGSHQTAVSHHQLHILHPYTHAHMHKAWVIG